MAAEEFLLLCKRVVEGEEDAGVGREEMVAALEGLLSRARVVDVGEYVRCYRYARRALDPHTQELLFERIDTKCRVEEMNFRSGRIQLGHFGQIERLSFDHGGRFFVSGGADGIVKLWDVKTGFALRSFIGHVGVVNDLCISRDGVLLVSCDSLGILNVWSLKEFRLVLQLRPGCEIMFAEFFDGEAPGYSLVVVLSRGVVKTYQFDISGVLRMQENVCLLDEAIKGLCFTDGGRFLFCGGWWPFLVMFDTCVPEGCVVLETDGMPVNTICGAKYGLRIAAACDAQVFQWAFFSEGIPVMGNFKKRTKETRLKGHWKRSVIRIGEEEQLTVERMCYLRSNMLVCVCTDMKIRMYRGIELQYVIDVEEFGILYPHPLEDVFAFCGSSLKVYKMDVLIHEETLAFGVADAQFSGDGECFVFGDERGVIRTISIGHLTTSPREQFFLCDFDRTEAERTPLVCWNDATFNSGRMRNEDWVQVEYVVSESSCACALIEVLGAGHFFRDFIGQHQFRRRYMEVSLPDETYDAIGDVLSDDVSSVQSFAEQSECEVTQRMLPNRKLMIESSEELEDE